MFVQTQLTPNENAIKFILNYQVYGGKDLIEVTYEQWEKYNQDIINSLKSSDAKISDSSIKDDNSCCQECSESPNILDSALVQDLFITGDIDRVMIGNDFLVITKKLEADWSIIKPEILSRIMDSHLTEEKVLGGGKTNEDHINDIQFTDAETDVNNETIKLINELIDERVKPAVAMDGGDIQFCGYRDNIVYVKMRGACSGCPSSSATLKGGVENMLKYYIPEIIAVESVS